MKRTLFIAICFFIFLNQFHSQIKVDANFEGGNCEVLYINDSLNTILFQPELKKLNTTLCWFYFRFYGFKKKEPVTLQFEYYNAVRAPNYPVYSYDKINWHKLEAVYHQGYKQCKQQFLADTVYFATGFPYLYSDLMEMVEELQTNKYVNITELTKSEGNRNIPLIEITDTTYSEKTKKLIWIIARQHAFESPGSFVVEGLIRFLASDHAKASELRQNAVIMIVPMMDVDNVVNGASGRMQYPIDFNRDWNPISHWKAVNAVKAQIESSSQMLDYKMFFDIHSPFPGAESQLFAYFDIYNQSPESDRLYDFWNIFKSHAGFKAIKIIHTTVNVGQVCADQYNSNPDCEVYNLPCYKSIDFSVTLECEWNLRPDGTHWTIENLLGCGENLGKTINDYLISKIKLSY